MAAFEIIGVLLALPSLIDLSFKYGEILMEKMRLFTSVDKHSSLQALLFELVEGNISDILGFFKEIASQLENKFSDQLSDLLRVLVTTLAKAISAFPEEFGGKLSKAKYVMYDARKIDEACREMELWQDRFLKRVSVHMQFVIYPKYGLPAIGNAPQAVSKQAKVECKASDQSDLVKRLERVRIGRRTLTGQLLISHDASISYEQVDVSPLWRPRTHTPHLSSLVEYRSYRDMDSETIEHEKPSATSQQNYGVFTLRQ